MKEKEEAVNDSVGDRGSPQKYVLEKCAPLPSVNPRGHAWSGLVQSCFGENAAELPCPVENVCGYRGLKACCCCQCACTQICVRPAAVKCTCARASVTVGTGMAGGETVVKKQENRQIGVNLPPLQ